jgi:hypothetical protein
MIGSKSITSSGGKMPESRANVDLGDWDSVTPGETGEHRRVAALLEAVHRDGFLEIRVANLPAEGLHEKRGRRLGADGLLPDRQGFQAREVPRGELGELDVFRFELDEGVREKAAEQLLMLGRADAKFLHLSP